MANDEKGSIADSTAVADVPEEERLAREAPDSPEHAEISAPKTTPKSSSESARARAESLEDLLGSGGSEAGATEWRVRDPRQFPVGASRWAAENEPADGEWPPRATESDDVDWDADLDASALDWDDAAPALIHAPRAAARAGSATAAVRRRKSGYEKPPIEPPSFLLSPQRMPEQALARKDPLSEAARSSLMGKVKSQKTKPELALKGALRALGLTNYRLAPRTLPGKPDIAFGGARVAVFVDGCFWHGCSQCYRKPEGNGEYWAEKKERNMARDIRVNNDLEAMGWLPVRFWEHELRGDGSRDAAEKVQLLVGQRLADADAAKKEKADRRAALLSQEPLIQ